MSTVVPARRPIPPDAARDRRRAWWSLALYPVSFVVAFVVGEGLADAVTPSDGAGAAWYVPVLVGIPAVLLLVVPGLLALKYGRRAVRRGDPDGAVPALVGAVVGLAFVGVNLLGFLAAVLL